MASKSPSPWSDDTSITYLDADRRVLPGPEGAAEVEIREVVEGVEIRRTYGSIPQGLPRGLPQWEPAGQVRGEPDAIDLTKNTWDVTTMHDGIVRFAESLMDLLTAMDWKDLPDAEKRANLTRLRTLPAWQAAPESLKIEVNAWLSA